MKRVIYFCFSVMILLSGVELAETASGTEADISNTEIKNIRVEASSDKYIAFSVTYQYDGKHGDNVFLSATPLFYGNKIHGGNIFNPVGIKKGAGVAKIVVNRYSDTPIEHVSELLEFSIFVSMPKSVESMPGILPYYNVYQKTVPLAIVWPTLGTGVAKIYQKNGNVAKNNTNISLPKIQIQSIKLINSYADRIVYEIEYQYDGESGDDLTLTAIAYSNELSRAVVESAFSQSVQLYKGKNTEVINVIRNPQVNTNLVTDKLKIKITGQRNYVDQNIQKTIPVSYVEKTFLTKVVWTDVVQIANQTALPSVSYDERVKQATSLIDQFMDYYNAKTLAEAKQLLDQLLIENPKYVPAYIQLARYQELAERNQKGIKLAENTLNTALNLDKKNADVYILLGDNLFFQDRLAEAENALNAANSLGTSNLWLYVNYARVFVKKGQHAKAIEYLEKLTNRESYELSNTRPLKYGYKDYIKLLTSSGDFVKLEKIYERRQRTFSSNGCYLSEYAEFELFLRGDYEKAIRLGEDAMQLKCSGNGFVSRRLSYAYLSKWAKKYQSAAKLNTEDNLFLKARIINSDTSDILYALSNSSKTEFSIGILLRAGLKIDDLNQDYLTATGLAVQDSSLRALKVLINSGANINSLQGKTEWSLLMIAAYNGNEEIVKYLLDKGADVGVKSKDGYSASAIAESRGYKNIAKLLQPKYRT